MKKEIRINCRGAEEVPVALLTPFQGALKTLSEENYVKCRDEILRDGFCEPVTVWKRATKQESSGYAWIILNGHQRVTTIKRMIAEEGYEPVKLPVSIVYVRDEAQANDLVLALTAQFGEMTNESLADFIRERNLDPKATVERFPHRETNPDKVLRLVAEPERHPDGGQRDENEDEVPPVPVDPRVSPGDVFQCGDHLIVCGDSSEEAPYLALGLDKAPADLVVTDPPYNVGSDSKNFAASASKAMKDLSEAEWDQNFDLRPALARIYAFLSPDVTVYVFTSHHLAGVIWDWIKAWPIHSTHAQYCVWAKPNPMPSLAKRHWTWSTELVCYATRGKHVFNFPEEGHALNVWTFTKHSDGSHPTQKPVAVIEHAIIHSSKPGAIVLDAFGGSGTTMIACEKTARQARLIEKSPQYVAVTLDRWERLTGKDAVRTTGTPETWKKIKAS